MTWQMGLAAIQGPDLTVVGVVMFGATLGWIARHFWGSRREAPSRLARLEAFFLGEETDRNPGHATQFETAMLESCQEALRTRRVEKGLVIRHRVLTDVTPANSHLAEELRKLKERGDGRWLGAYLEHCLNDPTRARELLALKASHENKGWQVISVEPAYETGAGLMVWLELEREVSRSPLRKSA